MRFESKSRKQETTGTIRLEDIISSRFVTKQFGRNSNPSGPKITPKHEWTGLKKRLIGESFKIMSC